MTRTSNIARLSAPLAVLSVLLLAAAPAAASSSSEDAEAIRAVVASAYIEGLHKNGSREDIRAGFHPDFVMSVHTDAGVTKVTIEEWIGRLPAEGQAPAREVTHEVPTVQVVDDTAVAQVEVFLDGEHAFTDFMGLYRFPEGWRIVTKIFQRH